MVKNSREIEKSFQQIFDKFIDFYSFSMEFNNFMSNETFSNAKDFRFIDTFQNFYFCHVRFQNKNNNDLHG